MASTRHVGLVLVLLTMCVLALSYGAQKASASAFESDAAGWLSKFSSANDNLLDSSFFDEDEGLMESESARRILAGQALFVSYGALSADRVVCAPRSGRSYYTPSCGSATGPVRPYTRGCSTYGRCARSGAK